jgi:hypothetical protein
MLLRAKRCIQVRRPNRALWSTYNPMYIKKLHFNVLNLNPDQSCWSHTTYRWAFSFNSDHSAYHIPAATLSSLPSLKTMEVSIREWPGGVQNSTPLRFQESILTLCVMLRRFPKGILLWHECPSRGTHCYPCSFNNLSWSGRAGLSERKSPRKC